MRRVTDQALGFTIVLIIALTLAAAFAEQVRARLWQSYADYASPFLGALPTGVAVPPASQRLVIVVIHGLRLAESRQMPTLNALRAQGADVTIALGPPTFRLPATFGWLSGARPETHGVTTNAPRSIGPDTLLRAAQAGGRTIALVGSDQLYDLFGQFAQRAELVDDLEPARRDQQAVELALEALRDPARPAQLVLIEFAVLDAVARDAPDSYAAAVAATDFRLRTIVDALNLTTDTFAVVSDRGLTRAGNDGGAEPDVARVPFVLVGAGVAPGTEAIAPATTIAPTLAGLIGVPIPVHAQGGPLFEALLPHAALPLISAQQLTAFYESWSEAIGRRRFASELLRRHEASLAAGSTAGYAIWLAELNATVASAVQARLTDERMARLPFVLGVGLLLLVVTLVLLSGRSLWPAFGAGAYAIAWLGLFALARGGEFSLSLFRDGDPAPTLQSLERESAMLMIGICTLVALTTGKRADALKAIATVLSTPALIVAANAAVVLWFYWQWGDTFVWTLPDASALVVALVALSHIAGLSLQIVPTLPELPLALLIAVGSAAIYALIRHPDRGADE